MHNFGQPPAPRNATLWSQDPASARARLVVSPCPIGGAGGAYWVKAPLQPGLEELEAHMESTTTSVQVQAAALLQQGRLGSLTFDYDLERHIKVIQKV